MLKTAAAKIDAKVSKIKWDQRRIKRANHRYAARSVRESLGFIATRAKTKELQRGKKGPSKPNKPPHVHTRKALSTIKYDYNYNDLTGVVGPVLQQRSGNKTRNQTTVPATLEYGGTYTIQEHWQQFAKPTEGRWVRTTRGTARSGGKLRKRKRRITIQPRPFMRPAFQFELQAGNLNKAFQDKWGT